VFAVVVFVAAPYGLTATCAAVAGFRLLNLVCTQYLLVQRLVGIPLSETLIRDVAPALAGCAALVAVSWPVTAGLERLGVPDLAVMAAASAGGLAAYALALRWIFPAAWRDLAELFGRLAARRRRAGPTVRAGS